MTIRRYDPGTTSQVIELSSAANDSVSSWVIQITGTAGSMSITPKGYIKGKPNGSGAALAVASAVGLAYYVGSTGTLTSSATPISSLGIYRIIADGCSVALDYTASGGSDLVIHATPVRG